MAIDRATIVRVGYGPAGQPTCNLVPAPAINVSTANDACLVQDIAGANALLDEAGWVDSDGDGVRDKDGVSLNILYQTSTNSVRQSTQALVKEWWEEIGVATELRNVDAAVFFGGDPASPDTYGKFFADVEMYTNGSAGTDPEDYLRGWRCDQISNSANQWLGNNNTRWCNEEYDALIDQLAATSGLEARAEIIKQLNDMVVQNYVEIPLVHRGSVSAHSNRLLGVRLNAWDSEMWNIADWTRASQ
jgi:peptide/nickel transport system substrate-binding protein